LFSEVGTNAKGNFLQAKRKIRETILAKEKTSNIGVLEKKWKHHAGKSYYLQGLNRQCEELWKAQPGEYGVRQDGVQEGAELHQQLLVPRH
jgi:hypothetical protein